MVVTYLSHHNQKMFVPRLSRIIHLSYLLDVWAIFEAIFKFLSRSYNQKTEVDKKNLVRGEQISGKNWLCQEVFFLVSVCNDHRMIVVTRPPARRQVPVKSYKCLILFAFRSVWSRSLSLLFLFHCFSSITVHPPSPASPIVVCYCCLLLLSVIVVWYCCLLLLCDIVDRWCLWWWWFCWQVCIDRTNIQHQKLSVQLVTPVVSAAIFFSSSTTILHSFTIYSLFIYNSFSIPLQSIHTYFIFLYILHSPTILCSSTILHSPVIMSTAW